MTQKRLYFGDRKNIEDYERSSRMSKNHRETEAKEKQHTVPSPCPASLEREGKLKTPSQCETDIPGDRISPHLPKAFYLVLGL